MPSSRMHWDKTVFETSSSWIAWSVARKEDIDAIQFDKSYQSNLPNSSEVLDPTRKKWAKKRWWRNLRKMPFVDCKRKQFLRTGILKYTIWEFYHWSKFGYVISSPCEGQTMMCKRTQSTAYSSPKRSGSLWQLIHACTCKIMQIKL